MYKSRLVLAVVVVWLVLTGVCLAGTDDILAPIFVNCPESTQHVQHCDTIRYTFKAVEPYTGMPSYWMRYHLVSGPGELDSITGEWNYILSVNDARLGEQTVEVAASYDGRITTGPQDCRFRFEAQNRPANVAITYDIAYGISRLPIGQAKDIAFEYFDRDICDSVSFFVRSTYPEMSGSHTFWSDNQLAFLSIKLDSADAGKIFVVNIGYTDQIDTNYFDIRIRDNVTPNSPPQMVNANVECTVNPPKFVEEVLTHSHCSMAYYRFRACDPEGDSCAFKMVSGPGYILNGEWRAHELQVGTDTVKVTAYDPYGSGQCGDTATVIVETTNSVPIILIENCGDTVNCLVGSTNTARLYDFDVDQCGSPIWSIQEVAPPVGATVSIDQNGKVTFVPSAAGDYTVTVGLSDGIVATPSTRQIFFHVTDDSPYQVRIPVVQNVHQGEFKRVDVQLLSVSSYETAGLGGFNLLMAYDNSALSLQSADIDSSTLYSSCGWEYFTYRFGYNGSCIGCPSGMVRAIGIAETNNGTHHPSEVCTPNYVWTLPATLFTLTFLTTSDRTYECQFIPIRFFWVSCVDNTFSNFNGSQLNIERRVFDSYPGTGDTLIKTEPVFPGHAGVPHNDCDTGAYTSGKLRPARSIDFYNGGLEILCSDSIETRGDLNLNGTAYEISDYVMFGNYFVRGLGAFGSHVQGSVAASDVNADGVTLSVADLCYLASIINGDASAYPPKTPVRVPLYQSDHIFSVDRPMGAAAFVFRGASVLPTLLATNMNMDYSVHDSNTYVLVCPGLQSEHTESFNGAFLKAEGELLSVEMATAECAPAIVDQVMSADDGRNGSLPKTFALYQNYPNPFNGGTLVAFDLPRGSDVQFDVLNLLGQVVYSSHGHYGAGRHQIGWDGTTCGHSAASGVYYYRLKAGELSDTKKMLLLK